MRQCVALVFLLTIFCSVGYADQSAEMPPPYKGSPGLEKIKSLAGEWSGVVTHGEGPKKGQEDKTTVSYRVTSNGSAVIETLFAGTPMEMTSVYFDRDGKLAMTHYCAVANRPTLELKDSSDASLVLSYSDGEELDPSKDMHIHGVEMEFIDQNTLVQRWLGHEGGKETHATVVKLSKQES